MVEDKNANWQSHGLAGRNATQPPAVSGESGDCGGALLDTTVFAAAQPRDERVGPQPNPALRFAGRRWLRLCMMRLRTAQPRKRVFSRVPLTRAEVGEPSPQPSPGMDDTYDVVREKKGA
jgi:hypothetical protein